MYLYASILLYQNSTLQVNNVGGLAENKLFQKFISNMTDMPKFDVDVLKEELCAAEIVFSWNKKLFTIFGVNPLKFNSLLYLSILSYSVMHFILSCADLPQNLSNVNNMIDSITEVGSMITVLAKFTLYWIKRRSLADLLIEVQTDYSIEKYRNKTEIRIFVDYVLRAKTFFKVAVPMSFASAILYFFRPFTVGGIGVPVRIDAANVTTFALPYRMRFYFPITEFTSYLGALLYLIPVIPITAFTLVADASLMLALVAHVCGQLSLLSQGVLTHFARNDASNFRQDIAKAVLQHYRLIGMARTIDSTFNLLMLQQILSMTFFLCFVGYSTLVHWSQRESALILTFLMCAAGTTFLLFAYCYAGQCLIDESVHLCDALYNSTWYDLEPPDLKYYLIIMNRTRIPLVVTGGRFYVYSLSSFLTVMKSAMAYLSVLRTLI